jgi:hypothetical protein
MTVNCDIFTLFIDWENMMPMKEGEKTGINSGLKEEKCMLEKRTSSEKYKGKKGKKRTYISQLLAES